MMKAVGFSILEFLLGMSLFLFILIYGYSGFDLESRLIGQMTARVRPEEESNYRLLVIKNLLQDARTPFLRDWRLANVPIFFTDLNFGKTLRADAFSVARSEGPPLDFVVNSGWIELSQASSFAKDDLVASAGATDAGTFDWTYAKVSEVASPQKIKVTDLLSRNVVLSGCLMKIEIDGFVYRNNTLYAVSSSGQNEPFFGPLENFTYSWETPQLLISWKSGFMNCSFRATL
jgi:hypothetical protein